MHEIDDFLTQIPTQRRKDEAARLDTLFRAVTGWQPVLHKGGMLGYGSYHYRYASGREGDCFATGFAPRKAKLSIYIMPGYAGFSDIRSRLGKHTAGKSCLYINKLPDVDLTVLGELIRAGLDDLAGKWPVTPT